MTWREWAKRELAALDGAGRLRFVRDFDARGHIGDLDGREVVSFADNDYLGLSADARVVAAASRALRAWGAGSGAARLVTGSRPVHSDLERAVAAWKETDAALLFPTGYATNLGVLAALGTAGSLICSDESNHASIVDGCRLARATVSVYPHRDVEALDRLLEGHERSIVVSDLVFSMDGDVAPVDDLVEVCTRHGALLILDEAHAALGPHPRLEGIEAVRVGTCSKMLGALGGFAAGPREIIDVLVSRARPFIFTTASSPADAAAALEALRILSSTEGDGLKSRLRRVIDAIVPGHPSPIVPVVLGSEERALAGSAELLRRGLLVPAIRPPSVPEGSSRLRITLSASHTDAQIERLVAALHDVVPDWER